MGQRGASAEGGPPAPGSPPRDVFARQVRDALAHLHDLPHLQTAALARQVPPDRRLAGPDTPGGARAPEPSSTGKALQRRLLAALAVLRPEAVEGALAGGQAAARPPLELARRASFAGRRAPGTAGAAGPRGPGRGHRLLTLRYVDGLSIEEVCAHFAISQSQYFREHRRGLRPRLAAVGARGPTASAETAGADSRLDGGLPVPLDRFIGRAGRSRRSKGCSNAPGW